MRAGLPWYAELWVEYLLAVSLVQELDGGADRPEAVAFMDAVTMLIEEFAAIEPLTL